MSDEDNKTFTSIPPKKQALSSLLEQRIAPLGAAGLSLNADVPDTQIEAMAKADVNQHGGPEHLGKLNKEQAQVYINSFNEAEQAVLRKDKGWFSDESNEDWKARSEAYIEKQQQWMDKQPWNNNDAPSMATESPERMSTPLDPFAEEPDTTETNTDPFNTRSLDTDAIDADPFDIDPFDTAPADDNSLANTKSVDMNEWDDSSNNTSDEIDDDAIGDGDYDDPFA